MNPPPPPPPPPHGNGNGTGNRGSGLPPGNYDIFIIPPHSSGSGFLYLPSLQPHRNSFLAGVGCTMLAMGIWTVVFPVLREWFATIVASGGVAVVILLIGVGVAGWAWGKTQTETTGPAQGSAGGASSTHTEPPHNGSRYTGSTPGSGPTPQYAPPPPPPPPQPEPQAPPKPTWQRANTGPANTNGSTNTGTGKGAWEKAREETRRKEEVRRRAEELRKKREEDEKERVRQREKDARERELRELREAREKREKEAREKREKESKEKEAKVDTKSTAPPPPPSQPSPRRTEPSRPPSPTKRHQPPTAQTATEDDAYSFRPYDKPKRPVHKTASTSASSIYSESSYAPSQSTSRTTPPPSHRGPYSSKDPDKIVLKAVYSFNNTFTKLPIAQLVSGVGSVTDGLILRITTEGLFIDDDVRGVPQREWDVKAWTLKLVEVWCPHLHASGAASGSTPAPQRTGLFGTKNSASKAPSAEESTRFVEEFARACKPVPKHYSSAASHISSRYSSNDSVAASQSGEFKGLHVLRASIRDQDGKRYVFVLQQEEGWKVAVGLQRLRRGTQVRALGVSGMAVNETKGILESMGWG